MRSPLFSLLSYRAWLFAPSLTRAPVVSASMPRIGLFVLAVVAVQGGLGLAWVVYQKRRGGASKKYL